ncbi:glycosyltransferase [Dactylosporangium matsuzakiense]|uniref:Glycosyl transferase n=1 Tax=Dactylosporangium matsuzakiense TaxID=53360 RepID=A0A9W6KJU0_9ACTN|nr:glycosyltransferase [Dactylosporangium matsuzakiense]GLL02287.1 glycosyl transferase [Dactylosporangium matsuzakiense]
MSIRRPEPSFAHLHRLSDDVGLFEHAEYRTPRTAHGYCVDDVARGLLVICREPDPPVDLLRLAEQYLALLVDAQAPDGSFRNRLGPDRRWQDEPAVGDWWGRALWGLGTAVARSPVPSMRETALSRFNSGAHRRTRWPRAMAFAALGAAEVLDVHPEHSAARWLLHDAVVTIGAVPPDPAWPWPEPRLTYANAALAETLIAAGGEASADGLRMLGWLLERETYDGHLSCTPVGGAGPDDEPPGFDQQPIEAAAMADACARAMTVSRDPRWERGLASAIDWFLGANDTGLPLHDPSTGGGRDGLSTSGRNENQGAESTLALLSALQHARRLDAAGDPALAGHRKSAATG